MVAHRTVPADRAIRARTRRIVRRDVGPQDVGLDHVAGLPVLGAGSDEHDDGLAIDSRPEKAAEPERSPGLTLDGGDARKYAGSGHEDYPFWPMAQVVATTLGRF